MNDIQADEHLNRQYREDLQQEISRNRAGKKADSGRLVVFARELSLDVRRVGAYVLSARQKKRTP